MKACGVLISLTLVGVVLAACGGGGDGSGSDATPNATFETLIDQARQTPVDEPVREYASMLCGPLQKLLETAGPALDDFATPEGTPDLSAAFGAAFEALGLLEEPFAQLLEDMREIDPPEELKEYHEASLAEVEYALEGLRALSGGDLTGVLAQPSPPPTAEPPSGIDAAIIQECGPELQELVGEFGGSLFANDDSGFVFPDEETPAPPETGAIGEAVANGAYELLVDELRDPYLSSDEFFEPEPGNRWVVVEVSITNTSEEAQQYGSYDFKLKDSDNFEYTTGFVDVAQELGSGSLPAGDTVRGQLGFEVPATASIVRLIFDPGFFGEARIDIELP